MSDALKKEALEGALFSLAALEARRKALFHDALEAVMVLDGERAALEARVMGLRADLGIPTEVVKESTPLEETAPFLALP